MGVVLLFFPLYGGCVASETYYLRVTVSTDVKGAVKIFMDDIIVINHSLV